MKLSTAEKLFGPAAFFCEAAGLSRTLHLALDPAIFGAHSLHKSLEMLRVYCRDAELFVDNAAAGLL